MVAFQFGEWKSIVWIEFTVKTCELRLGLYRYLFTMYFIKFASGGCVCICETIKFNSFNSRFAKLMFTFAFWFRSLHMRKDKQLKLFWNAKKIDLILLKCDVKSDEIDFVRIDCCWTEIQIISMAEIIDFSFHSKVQWPILGHESFIYCSMLDAGFLTNRLTIGYRHDQITMQRKVLLQSNNIYNDNNNCVTFNVHNLST